MLKHSFIKLVPRHLIFSVGNRVVFAKYSVNVSGAINSFFFDNEYTHNKCI